jgi:voltage-gated potassium channel
MLNEQIKKTQKLIERRRYALLLLSTVMMLILPAYSGSGLLFQIVFVLSISFLFIQSLLAANVKKSSRGISHYIVFGLIVVAILEPLGMTGVYLDLLKAVSFVTFFTFIIAYLMKFIRTSNTVNENVLMTSINIYLLGGIIGAFLAFSLFRIYPDAYSFPANIRDPTIVNFLYYSFITMSTVGYGDITPKIQETQTLAYLMSVAGQLYVAIIIAFLVGKMISSPERRKAKSDNQLE